VTHNDKQFLLHATRQPWVRCGYYCFSVREQTEDQYKPHNSVYSYLYIL